MADELNLNSPQMDVEETLDAIKDIAQRLDAHGCIVVLIHGDDLVHMESSHEYSFPSLSGYLMTSLVYRVVEDVSDE